MKERRTIDPFNRDVAVNDGYLYTTKARLSSTLANERLTEAALASTDFRGKRVLDVGCGDGTYTVELYDRGCPSSIHGIDFAARAVENAQSRAGARAITYETCSAEALPMADGSFDVAHLRGVLHHLENPRKALHEAMRVARVVVVIEPNGYNPVLKVLERVSRYHVEHNERSFFPHALHAWARRNGGWVRSSQFVGLVPFFCPDPVARALKAVESIFEQSPIVREVSCAVNVFVIERPSVTPHGIYAAPLTCVP